MKVLLDECIPRKLKGAFTEHDCKSAPEAGLAGKKNGDLLALAEDAGFDVFLTIDKGIEYQQNLAGRTIAVLIVRARSNRLQDLFAACERVSKHHPFDPAWRRHSCRRIETALPMLPHQFVAESS